MFRCSSEGRCCSPLVPALAIVHFLLIPLLESSLRPPSLSLPAQTNRVTPAVAHEHTWTTSSPLPSSPVRVLLLRSLQSLLASTIRLFLSLYKPPSTFAAKRTRTEVRRHQLCLHAALSSRYVSGTRFRSSRWFFSFRPRWKGLGDIGWKAHSKSEGVLLVKMKGRVSEGTPYNINTYGEEGHGFRCRYVLRSSGSQLVNCRTFCQI